ncbi:hypothetical protein M5K25_017237 [Dendrobium thyrsiflorum]|uniref:Uncharacterized protein n=1 Tax=Dendrobium thyrsiflorum TaxID=117978 RepID=A0ABD0UU82_DENTH
MDSCVAQSDCLDEFASSPCDGEDSVGPEDDFHVRLMLVGSLLVVPPVASCWLLMRALDSLRTCIIALN